MLNVPMDHGITIGATDGLRDIESTIDAVTAAGGEVVDIRTREPSLEDVFLDIVGRPMPGRYTVGTSDGSADEETSERTANDPEGAE